MAVVAHEAMLSRPTNDGAGQRAYLLAGVKRGNATAIAALRSPPYPDALGYLHDWSRELRGRHEGMHGYAPLTYEAIQAWANGTDQHPEPHEVRALIALDDAWRAALHDEAPAVAEPTRPASAWPAKKRGD